MITVKFLVKHYDSGGSTIHHKHFTDGESIEDIINLIEMHRINNKAMFMTDSVYLFLDKVFSFEIG